VAVRASVLPDGGGTALVCAGGAPMLMPAGVDPADGLRNNNGHVHDDDTVWYCTCTRE